MGTQDHQNASGKSEAVQTIVIPELEEIMERHEPRQPWTHEEDEILFKYYNKVPIADLAKAISYYSGNTRTINSVRSRYKSEKP